MKQGILKSLRQRFKGNNAGNVTVITAVSILPVIGVIGLAVDFQITVTRKGAVQQILDTSIIATARERQAGLGDTETRTFAQTYFTDLLTVNNAAIECENVVVTFAEDSEEVLGSVSCKQPTTLSAVVGKDNMDFTVSSAATFGASKVDVAFVFDLSSSMNSNNRLENLQIAANDAIDALLPQDADPGDIAEVRIALTAYGHTMNAGQFFEDVVEFNDRPDFLEESEAVGAVHADQHVGVVQVDNSTGEPRYFWDFEAAEGVDCEDGSCSSIRDESARAFYRDEDRCVYNRFGSEAFTDAPPGEGQYITAGHPIWRYAPNTNDDAGALNNNKINSYNNILGRYRGDIRDSLASGSNNPPVEFNPVLDRNISMTSALNPSVRSNNNINVAAQLLACDRLPEPLPLTDNINVLHTFVNDMTAFGATAGHLGIAWGWYLISPRWSDIWPAASEPLAYNQADTLKVLVVMTDGIFNSAHPNVDNEFPNSRDRSHEMAVEYCDNIKDTTDIIIYTIRFEIAQSDIPRVNGVDILTRCASGEGRALSADNGDELRDQFLAIAAEISELRLSQ